MKRVQNKVEDEAARVAEIAEQVTSDASISGVAEAVTEGVDLFLEHDSAPAAKAEGKGPTDRETLRALIQSRTILRDSLASDSPQNLVGVVLETAVAAAGVDAVGVLVTYLGERRRLELAPVLATYVWGVEEAEFRSILEGFRLTVGQARLWTVLLALILAGVAIAGMGLLNLRNPLNLLRWVGWSVGVSGSVILVVVFLLYFTVPSWGERAVYDWLAANVPQSTGLPGLASDVVGQVLRNWLLGLIVPGVLAVVVGGFLLGSGAAWKWWRNRTPTSTAGPGEA